MCKEEILDNPIHYGMIETMSVRGSRYRLQISILRPQHQREIVSQVESKRIAKSCLFLFLANKPLHLCKRAQSIVRAINCKDLNT
jgi:hypothetical protein